MTICIAAICSAGDTREIVICTDWKASSGLGSSETFLKQRPLANGWVCLTAGNKSDIISLYRLLRIRFRATNEISDENIITLVGDAVSVRKKQKATEYTQGKYAISYDDFLTFGKDKLPPDLFRTSMVEIEKITLGAEMVIAGFSLGYPLLCHISTNGATSLKEDFATIGEGEYLASSALLHREQRETDSLPITLYNVYEAKQYAERVGSVGELTSITLLTIEGRIRMMLGDSGKEWLRQKFIELGPKPVDKSLSFPEGFFYDMKR
jgi:20S proteasome alpha/beta subunit